MKVIVHEIEMGDVEDPEIYAAEPILKFEASEKGRWLMANSYKQMEYTIRPNERTYGWKIMLWSYLNDQDLTFYTLKWGEAEDEL
jgi:hypothetical protein